MKAKNVVLIGMLVMMILASCGSQATPTPIPDTPTPAPTPLPLIPTVAPPGIESNPMKMAIVPVDMREARSREETLEEMILDASSVYVDIVLKDTYADVLADLCASSEMDISVAWVDGLGWAAAEASNCGIADLVIQRGADEEETPIIGEPAHIIVTRRLGVFDISIIRNRTFCRAGYDDYYGWLLPSLILPINDIDLPGEVKEVIDYEDRESLLLAVAGNECTASGISDSELKSFIESDEVIERDVRIAYSTPPIPFGVLVYPLDVSLSFRLSLSKGLLELAGDEDASALMQPFFGQDTFLPVTDDTFTGFYAFVEELGVDFAALGG